MLICSVAGVDWYQRDYTVQGGVVNVATSELNLGSSGAVGEAGALAFLHWRFMGEHGKLLSSKCVSFQALI